MTLRSLATIVGIVFALPTFQACEDRASIETVTVSLANTEEYTYPTVGADEEGATISSQARHYSTSELRRDATTGWIATYVYRPAAGFVGSDDVQLEIRTGSDGVSPPTRIKRVAIHFVVH